MKILLIAPVHDYLQFSKQKKHFPFVEGQGQQSWYDALVSLGHDVKVFRYSDSLIIPEVLQQRIAQYFIRISPQLYGRLRKIHDKMAFFDPIWKIKNSQINSIADVFRPNYIFVSGGTAFFSLHIFRKLKSIFKTKIIYFSGVHPKNAISPHERKWVQNCADYVITNDKGYENIWNSYGIKKVLTLPISAFNENYDQKKLSAHDQKKYQSDICFVGSITSYRLRILEMLTDYNLRMWGDLASGVKLSPRLKPFYCGKAYYDDMQHIYSHTKIGLNFQPEDMEAGGNMRSFEIPGYGAFQLTDKMDPSWFINGKEIVIFKTKEDLLKKINYYLSNILERKKIANAGYIRTLREHTYKKRFKKLFLIIKNTKHAND